VNLVHKCVAAKMPKLPTAGSENAVAALVIHRDESPLIVAGTTRSGRTTFAVPRRGCSCKTTVKDCPSVR